MDSPPSLSPPLTDYPHPHLSFHNPHHEPRGTSTRASKTERSLAVNLLLNQHMTITQVATFFHRPPNTVLRWLKYHLKMTSPRRHPSVPHSYIPHAPPRASTRARSETHPPASASSPPLPIPVPSSSSSSSSSSNKDIITNRSPTVPSFPLPKLLSLSESPPKSNPALLFEALPTTVLPTQGDSSFHPSTSPPSSSSSFSHSISQETTLSSFPKENPLLTTELSSPNSQQKKSPSP